MSNEQLKQDALTEAIKLLEKVKNSEEITLGVGEGSGNLFVHGNHESIKQVQRIIDLTLQRGNDLKLAINTIGRLNSVIQERDRQISEYQRLMKSKDYRHERLIKYVKNVQTDDGSDIEAVCEILEANGKTSFNVLCEWMQYTGRKTATVLSNARSQGLIELIDGYYHIASR